MSFKPVHIGPRTDDERAQRGAAWCSHLRRVLHGAEQPVPDDWDPAEPPGDPDLPPPAVPDPAATR